MSMTNKEKVQYEKQSFYILFDKKLYSVISGSRIGKR